ncbi:MAG: glycosyltransferase family 1 protein [Clostridiales bacterium]|nr:glycosyltransferase family 1 protein [Clostridiales bacterium]
MYLFGKVTVIPQVPERINRLEELAYNLWWSWNVEALKLFKAIDIDLWEKCQKNPVKFINNVEQSKLEIAVKDEAFLKQYDSIISKFDSYQKSTNTWYNKKYPNVKDNKIAYFSAEYGLDESFPIYSGGLGILSGDHCKSASDLGMPFYAIGLLYRQGYFNQRINKDGWQETNFTELNINELPVKPVLLENGMELVINVDFPGRTVFAKVWQVNIGRIKLYLLDTNVEPNSQIDREITARLYGGDQEMRIQQEIFLGIGGLKALKALGVEPTIYHMNEGHSSFVCLELLKNLILNKQMSFKAAKEIVSSQTIFTTHTPVPAGIDIFPISLIDKYFGGYWDKMGISRHEFMELGMFANNDSGQNFNMGVLALKLAGKRNGVSKLHGEVSRDIFGDVWPLVPKDEVPIGHVTNGVHTLTWLEPKLRELYTEYLGDNWINDISNPKTWKKLDKVPNAELWKIHQENKKKFIQIVRENKRAQLERNGASPYEIMELENMLDPNVLTIGFARRFATYKRANLIFRDIERIKRILGNPDMPLQIIFAGKAHPADRPGQEIIKNIVDVSNMPEFKGKVIMLENYNMSVARYMLHGVDIWLNNPRRPLEASGTSGQKAAINGAINFSILDGWWIEGYKNNSGWSIGKNEYYSSLNHQDNVDSDSIYTTLEKEILPLYYTKDADGLPNRWINKMKDSIKVVAPEFSTERMLIDYANDLYVPQVNRTLEIAENGFAKVFKLAEWKENISRDWGKIHINPINLTAYENTPISVNQTIEPACLVYLGSIKPEDVNVEVYVGKITDTGVLCESKIKKMDLVQKNGDMYEYRSEVLMNNGGNYGFTYRVVPKNSMLASKQDMGLVKWVM